MNKEEYYAPILLLVLGLALIVHHCVDVARHSELKARIEALEAQHRQ